MEPTQAPLTIIALETMIADLRAASDTWFPQDLIMKLEILIALAYKGYDIAQLKRPPVQ